MRKEKFTPADHDAVAAHYSKMRKLFFFIMAAQVVMIGVVSWALHNANVEEWYLFIGAFVLSDIVVLVIMSKKWKDARADLQERMKVTGTFKVTGKIRTKNTYSFMVDSEVPRKVQVSRKVYNRIAAGEELHFEFAEHCGILLELKRGEEILYSTSRQHEIQMSE